MRPRTRSVVMAVAAASATALMARLPAQAPRPASVPAVNELATSVGDGFTMASVGDLILAYPQSQNPDPAFQSVVKLLKDADVATGNYEGNIIDGRTFQ